jgi:hypothetical protein
MATPCIDGAASELLSMRRRLMKTQLSMKHKGISLSAGYLRMR